MAHARCFAVAALLVALLSACSGTATPRHLVLIVIDTLRADHLPFHGYERNTAPHLAALAEQGFVFERARSAGGWTKPSVASLLTGLYPVRHGVVYAASAHDPGLPDLPRWLADRGFYVFFVNGGNFFLGRHFGFPDAFTNYALASPVDAAGVVDGFQALLDARPTEQPFFGYVHFMDPHLPYNRHPHNERFTRGDGSDLQPEEIKARLIRERAARGELTAQDRERIRDLYDGQIRWVDEQIGRLMEGLAAAAVLDETLVVVTSDHGEEFWEHGGFEHGHALYPETTRVPLLLSGPGVPAGRSDQLVSGVDVAPTLLEAVGVDPTPLDLDGRSLWPIIRGAAGDADRAVFASGTLYGPEKYTVVRGEAQLIENTREGTGKWPAVPPPPPAPLEWITLPPEQTATRDELRNTLARHREAQVTPASADVEIDEELAEQLESIGYAR